MSMEEAPGVDFTLRRLGRWPFRRRRTVVRHHLELDPLGFLVALHRMDFMQHLDDMGRPLGLLPSIPKILNTSCTD